MRSLLAALFLVAAGTPATAQLMTICVEVPGPNVEVTLKKNGEIFIDMPWPVPNQTVMLPGWIMPPNACPVGKKNITASGADDAKAKVAGCIAGYLIGKWVAYVATVLMEDAQATEGNKAQGLPPFATAPSLQMRPRGPDPNGATTTPTTAWSPTWGRELVNLIVTQVEPYVP